MLLLTHGTDAEVHPTPITQSEPPTTGSFTMTRIVVVFHSGYGYTQRMAQTPADASVDEVAARFKG